MAACNGPLTVVGNDGAEVPGGGDSTMARRLRGGLNDRVGSGEVDDRADHRKFWQPDGVSERL
jgi:hypothetical protein